MSDITLCPHCKTYVDRTLNPGNCPTCNESLKDVGSSSSNQSGSSVAPENGLFAATSASNPEIDSVRCPKCNDLVSTRFRPVTCYKCGPIPVDPKSLPPQLNEDVYVQTYLIPNIILCFLGCLIPAIVGLVHSILALSAKRRGDYDTAHSQAIKAQKWMTLTIVLSVLLWLGWIGNHMR